MNLREWTQFILTAILMTIWCAMVAKGKASPEGLIVVSTYAVKKWLDLMEKKNGGD